MSKECKGLIFRGRLNVYIDKNGKYIYQESMAKLKRLSCNGCPECDWIIEEVRESIGNRNLPIIRNIIDGELYKINVINEQRDWETGYIDDYDLEFVRVNKYEQEQLAQDETKGE